MGTRKTTSQLKDATAIEAGVSESSGKRAAFYLRRSPQRPQTHRPVCFRDRNAAMRSLSCSCGNL